MKFDGRALLLLIGLGFASWRWIVIVRQDRARRIRRDNRAARLRRAR